MKKGGQKKLTLLAKFSYEPYIYREKGLTPFIPPPLTISGHYRKDLRF